MKITRVEAFQVQWAPTDKPSQRSAFVRVHTDNGMAGLGETSPMQGGRASLGMIVHDVAPMLVGCDPLDHAVAVGSGHALVGEAWAGGCVDRCAGGARHRAVGSEGQADRSGRSTSCSAGRGRPRCRSMPRSVVMATVRLMMWCGRWRGALRDKPAAVKIRFDNNRTALDADIPGDIAKARAVRKLVGDGFPLAFDANNCYTIGGAIRVGRALEDLGFWWFEEPVQHLPHPGDGRGCPQVGHHRFGGRADLYLGRTGRPDQCGRTDGATGYRQDGRYHWAAALCRAGPCAWGGTGAASDPTDDRSYGQPACGGVFAPGHQTRRVERSVNAHPTRCSRIRLCRWTGCFSYRQGQVWG